MKTVHAKESMVLASLEEEISSSALEEDIRPGMCACFRGNWDNLVNNEEGMTTLEYAMGALAAMALAGALYLVVSSGAVADGLESIIMDALNNRAA